MKKNSKNFQPAGDPNWLGKETRTVEIEREDNYMVWHCFDCNEDLEDPEELEDHKDHSIGKVWKYPVRKVVVEDDFSKSPRPTRQNLQSKQGGEDENLVRSPYSTY